VQGKKYCAEIFIAKTFTLWQKICKYPCCHLQNPNRVLCLLRETYSKSEYLKLRNVCFCCIFSLCYCVVTRRWDQHKRNRSSLALRCFRSSWNAILQKPDKGFCLARFSAFKHFLIYLVSSQCHVIILYINPFHRKRGKSFETRSLWWHCEHAVLCLCCFFFISVAFYGCLAYWHCKTNLCSLS